MIFYAFFPNEEIELWSYNETEEYNDYGDPIVEYNLVGTYPCNIDPLTTNDSIKKYGKILQDTYTVFLDSDVPIEDTMILRLKGKPETFKILGTPMLYNHFLKHYEVEIQKQRTVINLKQII